LERPMSRSGLEWADDDDESKTAVVKINNIE
jgi:hypothetical protein